MAEDGRFRVDKVTAKIYLPFSRKSKKLTSMADAKWEILDGKVVGTIQLCLVASVAFKISKEMKTEGLMMTLAKLYEKPLASNKVFIIKHLFNMNMFEGKSIADHLNEFNTVTSKLSFVGVNDDEVRTLLILCSLLESWNGLFMSISNFFSLSNTLKFDNVGGAILSKEMRQKSSGETLGNALTTKTRRRKMERGRCPVNHSNKRKGRSKSTSRIVC